MLVIYSAQPSVASQLGLDRQRDGAYKRFNNAMFCICTFGSFRSLNNELEEKIVNCIATENFKKKIDHLSYFHYNLV